MINHTLVLSYRSLFEGRTDVQGKGNEPKCVHEPVVLTTWYNHLYGDTPIGIYPMRDDGMVKWGCVDFDGGDDDLDTALMLFAWLFTELGIHTWIEKSRSKGYHLWLFAEEWVPGAHVRRTLMAGCVAIGYSPKEINPKQEKLGDGVLYGNYVRLAYPHVRGDGQRVYGQFDFLSVSDFVEMARERRVSAARLAETAELWSPPAITHQTYLAGDIEKALLDRLDGLTYHVFTNGPSATSDRSTTLMRLAYLIAEKTDLDGDEAMTVMIEANDRWGKWHDNPAKAERELGKMLDKAFTSHRLEEDR